MSVSFFIFELYTGRMLKVDPNDPGFFQSVKLMLFGGLLMLSCIVALNKLFIHYVKIYWGQRTDVLLSFSYFESQAFQIQSRNELHFTWAFCIISLSGLVMVIFKLVKTWKQ